MSYLIIAAQLRWKSIAFELLINDAVAYSDRTGEEANAFVKLNPWIGLGESTLEVRVSLPAGLGAGELPADARLEIEVLEAPHGKEPGPEAKRFDFVFDRDKLPSASPLVLGGEKPRVPESPGSITVLRAPLATTWHGGPWAYETALPAELPRDAMAVVAVVGDLAQALGSRDVKRVLDHFAVVDPEMDRAYDLPPGMHAVLREGSFEPLFGDSGWKVEPIDPRLLVLTPRSGGRAVEVTGPNGAPAIVASSGIGGYRLTPVVANLAGSFRIVR
jgi:hypothetical protein